MLLIFLGDSWVFDRSTKRSSRNSVRGVKAKYPGAGPQEVEEAVCIPIGEAVQGLPGIKRLVTEVEKDECLVKVEVLAGHDLQAVMNAIRSQAQAIPQLPKPVKRIEVSEAGQEGDNGVIWVALHRPSDMRRGLGSNLARGA